MTQMVVETTKKPHDRQKPPAVIHLPYSEFVEDGIPERPELIEVGVRRLVLHEHRANHTGNTDEH